MKKLFGIMIALMLALTIVTAAYAEDNVTNSTDDGLEIEETDSNNSTDSNGDTETETETEDDSDAEDETETEEEDEEETEDETESEDDEDEVEDDAEKMNTPLGAEIRLLQLERDLTKRLIQGIKIVEVAEENGVDVSGFNDLLDRLEALIDVVSETDVEKTPEDLAVEFETYKEEAHSIAEEFKALSEELIDEELRALIRDELKELTYEEVKEIQDEIRELINLHNKEKFDSFVEKFNLDVEKLNELNEKVQSGEMTIKEAKKELTGLTLAAFRKMDSGKKDDIKNKVREEAVERNIYAKAVKNKVETKAIQNREELLSKTSAKLDVIANRLGANGNEKASERLEALAGKLDERADALGLKLEKYVQNREELQNRIEKRLPEGTTLEDLKEKYQNDSEFRQNINDKAKDFVEENRPELKDRLDKIKDKIDERRPPRLESDDEESDDASDEEDEE